MGRRWQPSIADQLEDGRSRFHCLTRPMPLRLSRISSGRSHLREGNRALRFPRTVELARGARLNLVKNLLAS